MPNHHQQGKPQRRCGNLHLPGRLAGLLPLSALSFAVTASAQTTSSVKEGTSPGTTTPAANANAPAFSRGAPTGTTPSPSVSEVTIEEPGIPANTPPSFYGMSGPNATSSLGLPGFAAVGPEGQAPVAPGYPLQWGPFSAHPHLAYGFTYATGLLGGPNGPTETIQHGVSPGLSIISKHLSIDYTPSLSYYSKGPYEDSLNHNASLAAHFGYADWTFHLSQGYQNSTAPLVETGRQTQTEVFSTSVGASWNFSERWFFDFSFSQALRNSAGFENSRQWSTMDWANYRLTPYLSVGAGIGGGYVDVDTGSDSTYELIQGKVSWHPSKRLSLDLNGGIEIRQFLDNPGQSDSLINPIMGASMAYQLFESTSLYLSANRSVDTSLFANQITENAIVSGGVSQRFLKHLTAGVSAGYRRSDYKNTFVFGSRSFPVVRRDDYTYVSATLGTSFLKKGSASISYTHGENESSVKGLTYGSDQVSVQIAYRF